MNGLNAPGMGFEINKYSGVWYYVHYPPELLPFTHYLQCYVCSLDDNLVF